MIWLAWRQFRTAAVSVFGGLAALTVVLALTGPGLADAYASGMAACAQRDNCSQFLNEFLNDHQGAFVGVAAVVLVLPALIGVFWGAPLISRELETGTHRLVWNQSITRTRWLAVKLGLTGLSAMVVAGLCSLAASWWSSTIDQMSPESLQRLGTVVFDARGIVPIGYAAFAFALGVTVGLLVRRALPAMAITLAVFVAVQIAMPLLVRPHLLPPNQETVVISASILDGLSIPHEGSGITVQTKGPGEGDWLLSRQTVDASGKAVETIPLQPDSGPCAPSGSPEETISRCLAEIERLGYRQQLTYHEADRFWTFQWIETAIYTTAALGLSALCFWWTRRRLS